MLSRDALKVVLQQDGLTRTDKLLLCLAVDSAKPKSVSEIRTLAHEAGLRAAANWNISSLLSASGKAVRAAGGWELGVKGKEVVHRIAPHHLSTGPPKLATSLRSELVRIADSDVRSFVNEAVVCFESHLYRAAVVLSWVGALSLLYDHVVAKELRPFNIEASRRNAKWKDAKTKDDLALMAEYEFLQVIEAISVIGKSVRHELESCLKLRNGCGHPNSLKIGVNRVSAHIETLILNVFSQFPA